MSCSPPARAYHANRSSQLGSAAFVGVVAGLALRCTSDSFVALLGLSEDNEAQPPTKDPSEEVLGTTRETVKTLEGVEMDDYGVLDDWQWLDTFKRKSANAKPNMRAKRRRHSLLAQSIPEESTSSSAG